MSGRLDAGDRFLVTYSQAMDASSFCSTWSGTGDQSITPGNVVTVTVINNGAPSGNDLLTASTSASACGGQFHFGSVDLGSPNHVQTNSTFSGPGGLLGLLYPASTIAYDSSSRLLTVTLGALASGSGSDTVTGAITYMYTPDPVIQGANGRSITGTVTS
ncbi:hypothetical protein BH20ACT23_BH20ACT23_11590 [soil metagenome]